MVFYLKRYVSILLLGALLGGCTVYEHLVHPHRLPTPAMSPQAKARVRAAEKARHKGTSLKPAEPAAADAAAGAADPAPGAATPAAADKSKALAYSDLSDNIKLKYDKHLLLKKPKLERRRLHHYEVRPLAPNKVNRAERRLRHHSKGPGKPSASPKAPAVPDFDNPSPTRTAAPAPRPDPTQPAPAPVAKPTKAAAAEEKPAKLKKPKKAPVPKPDPTQPLTGDH